MKNIVVASDSFKGSLTSEEVAEAAAEGIRAVFPECNVTRICIADGGEGTTEALVRALGGESVQVDVHDPLMRPMKATYGITGHGRTLPDGSCAGRTAIMEMSAASGLPLLAPEERDPMKTTTFGTGEMIMEIYGIPPCREIGLIKEYIKDAILDGTIPNDRDAALALMREKASELGLKEV